jgi:uncharacterized protein
VRRVLEYLDPKGLISEMDGRAAAVLLAAPALLTLREYLGSPRVYTTWAQGSGAQLHYVPPLAPWAWWSGMACLTMLVLPALLVRFCLGARLRDFGFAGFDVRVQLPLALGLYLLVLPAILVASRQPDFVAYYPMCGAAALGVRYFMLWEMLYIAQFVAVEFFFRGFLIYGLERSLGGLSIFVACVPYCMLHYGKPMLEAYGAIVAGVVLGTISYRSRSLWSGVLVHVMVALTMDVLALQARHLGWF